MSDPKFDDFKRRLDAAQDAQHPKAKPRPNTASGMGAGMRIAIDFVVAVVVGFGLGLWLDRLLGTKPWLMLVLFFLGIAAAFRNAVRTANRLDAEAKARREAGAGEQAQDAMNSTGPETRSAQKQEHPGLAWSDDDEDEPWIHDTKD